MTMPAPIPIARTSQGFSPSDTMIGSSRLGNSFGTSFLSSSNSGGSSSFREAMAMATSFGKDVNDLMIDYTTPRFGSSVDSEMTIAPSTSFGQNDVETSFCRNFNCCNLQLNDLHDLLQHYEEAHVRFDDDGMPGMIEDDGTSSGGSVSTPSSMPPSPRTSNARNAKAGADGKRRALGLNIQGDGSNLAADNDSPTLGKGKKRSFGQYDAATNQTPGTGSVHQSLRRALIDGGVGRGNRSTPSIYSANSPFSTPGSSIPGTPLGDDGDFAFGQPNLNAFSTLSLRPGHGEDHLPACAPPNLFFPAAGSSSTVGGNATTVGHPALNALPSNIGSSQPPAKRERISSNSGDKLDKDGKAVDKPFKCPTVGCDKAYKQANGLKYHRLHGSCNKNLSSEEVAAAAAAAAAANGGSTGTPANGSPAATTLQASQPPPKAMSPGTPATSSTSPLPPSLTRPAATVSTGPAGTTAPGTQPQTNQSANAKPAAGGPQQQQQTPNMTQSPRPTTNVNTNTAAAKPVNTRPSGNPSNSTTTNPGAPGNNMAKGAAPPANANKPGTFPLPGNINSAALAAATALLQRGGPLPPSIQGQHGPIDSAALLKTLQMLQQQMAQQQSNNQQANAGQFNKGPGTNAGINRPPGAGINNNANNQRPAAPANGLPSNNNGNHNNNLAGPNKANPGPAPTQPNRGGSNALPQGPAANNSPALGNLNRTGNLTNTQPMNNVANQGGLKPASTGPSSGNAAGATSAPAPAQKPANSPVPNNAGNAAPKQSLASSGITPQMLAAAQQAAAQKRAQQAGAQRPS